MKDERRVRGLTRTRAKIAPTISKTCFIGGYFAASLFRVSILSSRSDAWASSVRVTILPGGASEATRDARADGAIVDVHVAREFQYVHAGANDERETREHCALCPLTVNRERRCERIQG